MSARSKSLVAATSALLGACALAVPTAGLAGAAAAPIPTVKIALNGTRGITLSGSTVSGAVNIAATFTGKAPTGPNSNGPTVGLFQVAPGASFHAALRAVGGSGDLNKLAPYGKLVLDASAPGTVQTVLTPGTYEALNITGNGLPGFTQLTVTKSAAPAALPPARATEASVEFGFTGPSVLHSGEVVRAENQGFLVHMITLIGVPDAATGHRAIALLRAGDDKAVMKLATPNFVNLLGPVSPGGMQQEVLNAKPGYYVEACFMDTQDGREHTQLGMERLVRVVQ